MNVSAPARPETLRAFIAIPIPKEVLDFLARLQGRLTSAGVRGRWVKPEAIHLTLKFLGDISATAIAPLSDALREAAAGTGEMTLKARGVGVFPGLRRPRVLWSGVVGDVEALQNLHRRIESGMEQAGLPKERRPFQSHLTIARFREDSAPGPVEKAIAEMAEAESTPFAANRVVLYRSALLPQGARYTSLAEALLT